MPMAELNRVMNLFGFLQYFPPLPLNMKEKNSFLGNSQLITEQDLLLSFLPWHVRNIFLEGHCFKLPLMHCFVRDKNIPTEPKACMTAASLVPVTNITKNKKRLSKYGL